MSQPELSMQSLWLRYVLSGVVYVVSTLIAYQLLMTIPSSWVFSPLFLAVNYSVFAVALAGLLAPKFLQRSGTKEWRYASYMLFACGLIDLLVLVLVLLAYSNDLFFVLSVSLLWSVFRPLSLLLLIQSLHDLVFAVMPKTYQPSLFLVKVFIVYFAVILAYRLDIPEFRREPNPNRFDAARKELEEHERWVEQERREGREHPELKVDEEPPEEGTSN